MSSVVVIWRGFTYSPARPPARPATLSFFFFVFPSHHTRRFARRSPREPTKAASSREQIVWETFYLLFSSLLCSAPRRTSWLYHRDETMSDVVKAGVLEVTVVQAVGVDLLGTTSALSRT